MTKLLFQNPVFTCGENLSCRKGIKWDLAEKSGVEIAATDKPETVLIAVNIKTKVMRFCDLKDSDVIREHDPECRTIMGLLKGMEKVYPGFDKRELVTLVTFCW
jgi:hypothetical protein